MVRLTNKNSVLKSDVYKSLGEGLSDGHEPEWEEGWAREGHEARGLRLCSQMGPVDAVRRRTDGPRFLSAPRDPASSREHCHQATWDPFLPGTSEVPGVL